MAETRSRSAKSRAKRPAAKKRSTAKRPAAKSSAKKRSTAKRPAAGRGAPRSKAASSGAHETVCTVTYCPICQAAKVTEGAGPEAFGHLLAAAREFFLAAKVVMEAMPSDAAPWRDANENGGTPAAAASKAANAVKGKLQKISVS